MSIKILWKKFGGILFLFIFVLSIKILPKMDTTVIEARRKSDIRLRNFPKRNDAKVINANEQFDSAVYRRLFEEDLVDTDEQAKKVIAALKVFCRQRGLSMQIANIDELLEEYEDMILGCMMDNTANEPVESMDDVMEFLRQR